MPPTLPATALPGQKLSPTLLPLHTHVDRPHVGRINIEHQGDRLASGRRHLVEVSRLREDAPKRRNRSRPPLARLHNFDAMSQGGHVRFHGSTILSASARMPRALRRAELCCERGRLRTAVLSGTCANCPRGVGAKLCSRRSARCRWVAAERVTTVCGTRLVDSRNALWPGPEARASPLLARATDQREPHRHRRPAVER